MSQLQAKKNKKKSVHNRKGMSDYDRVLTINLDLSSLNTQKVTSMNSMFLDCDSLSTLSIGEKFAFVGTYYNLPSDTWYSSNGTAYISNGNSCTIPSDKADTYTRK